MLDFLAGADPGKLYAAAAGLTAMVCAAIATVAARLGRRAVPAADLPSSPPADAAALAHMQSELTMRIEAVAAALKAIEADTQETAKVGHRLEVVLARLEAKENQ